MKKYLINLLAAVILFTACNNKSGTKTMTTKNDKDDNTTEVKKQYR